MRKRKRIARPTESNKMADLYAKRKELGITVYKLAQLAGVEPDTIIRFEDDCQALPDDLDRAVLVQAIVGSVLHKSTELARNRLAILEALNDAETELENDWGTE